jgi:hypothetical protein
MFAPTDCLRNQECKKKVPASLCVVEDENSSEKFSTRDEENYENLD